MVEHLQSKFLVITMGYHFVYFYLSKLIRGKKHNLSRNKESTKCNLPVKKNVFMKLFSDLNETPITSWFLISSRKVPSYKTP